MFATAYCSEEKGIGMREHDNGNVDTKIKVDINGKRRERMSNGEQ